MPTVRPTVVQDEGVEVASCLPHSATEARQQIRQHQEAIEVLQEFLALLEKATEVLLNPNGAASTIRRKNPATEDDSARMKVGAPTGLKRAVRELAPKLQSPFTTHDFLGKLRGRVQFKGDPKAAIRDAVTTLYKDGFLELVKKGTGGRPNQYRIK